MTIAMHTQRIDALLAQILVSASKLDDYQERDMGQIHFIKYLYLVDLYYAEQHGGETFTGIPWRFHHFGPWDTAVYNHLEKGLAAIGAVKKTISSQYGRDDFSRWSLGPSSASKQINSLGVDISLFLERQVKKFANHTPELLDFVYKTPPMLRAAPEEYLSFEPSGFSFREPDIFTRERPVERTDKQKKKLREWETQAKTTLAERFKEIRKRQQPRAPVPAPRYDEVFFQAMMTMDASDLQEIEAREYAARMDVSVWKSAARRGEGVS
jgi:hypothetical protein